MVDRTQLRVASMVAGTDAVLSRFVRHHQDLGVDSVALYLDRPRDLDLAGVDDERLEIHHLDQRFWDNHGPRPGTVAERQPVVFTEAVRRAPAGWVACIDSDEFLLDEGEHLRTILDTVTSDVPSVTLRTAEAVWGPGDDVDMAFGATYFRTMWSRARWLTLGRIAYPRLHRFLRFGLLSHTVGKSITRAGSDLVVDVHFAVDARSRRVSEYLTDVADAEGTWLAHFDAIGKDHFSQKWARRTVGTNPNMHPRRVRQLEHFAAQARDVDTDPEALARTFESFYGVNPAQVAISQMNGVMFRRRLWPNDHHPV